MKNIITKLRFMRAKLKKWSKESNDNIIKRMTAFKESYFGNKDQVTLETKIKNTMVISW